MKEDEIGRLIVDVAVRIHRELGSGLLETVYEVTNKKLGYLLNFGDALMKHGITRIVNQLVEGPA